MAALRNNQVIVRASNVLRVTVWLARDSVDFTKPVSCYGSMSHSQSPRRSLNAASLEDLYQRGDRQHLFLAKETFDLK